MNKVTITCAGDRVDQTQTMSPYLPVTPDHAE
jgi:uncharacterized protein (DUF849 family)